MGRLGVILAVVLFVDAALFGTLIPLLPELTDAYALDKGDAGLLFGAFGAGALAGGIPAGLLAHRLGPRRTVVAGLLVLVLATLAFALADDPVALGLSRLAQGVSSIATWSGALGWIAAATPRARRGQALGTAFGVAVFGFIVGPVIGALARETSIEAVFLGLSALAALLALLVGLQREPPREEGTPGAVPAVLRDPRFLAGLWLNLLPALFFGLLDVLATLDLDAGGFGSVAVAAVFVTAGVAEAIVNPLVGRLADRRGRLLPVRHALAASVIVAIGFALTSEAMVVAALILAASLSFGGFYTPGMALVADRAEASGLPQGLGFGISNTVWAAGASVGPFAGAALADATSDAAPYAVCAALCAVTLAAVSARARPGDPR